MRTLTAVLIAMFLTGCVSFEVPSYAPDPAVSGAMNSADKKLKVTVAPPAFPDEGSLKCRAVGPVRLPQGQTFSQYIADALRQELTAAGAFDGNAGTNLDLKLLKVDFSSRLGASNWFINTEYALSGETFFVSTVYNDRSSYFGEKACANMAEYFRKAVSKHIQELAAHPVFRKSIGR